MSFEKLNVGDSGDAVERLHAILRKYGFEVSVEEAKRKFFGPTTRQAVCDFQASHGLARTGIWDEATAAVLSKGLREATSFQPPAESSSTHPNHLSDPSSSSPPVTPPDKRPPSHPTASRHCRVEGRIILETGGPAANLELLLIHRGFRGAELELAKTTTDECGHYTFDYDAEGKRPNLEVRAVKSDGTVIPLSGTKFGAGEKVVLNLVAPVSLQPLPSEYQRLTKDLAEQIGDLSQLKEAREDAERQDLTVLNRATGWDARLIALAAQAERLSADPEVKLSQEVLYGLLRAGVPSDKRLLALVDADVAEQTLWKVRDSGIIQLDNQQIGEFRQQFATFAGVMVKFCVSGADQAATFSTSS